MPHSPITHEQFIHAVRSAALRYATHDARPPNPLSLAELTRVANAKLVYGRGVAGLRGVTQYGAWKNGSDDELIEICAAGEENWIQLAGTTIHELAHAATGHGHGHNKEWRRLCAVLGLRRVHAAGTLYKLANFAPPLRMALAALPHPNDGQPNLGSALLATLGQLFSFKSRPCSAGIGTRGGKSRGIGSGSRLRKYTCGCGVIIRASRDNLNARCLDCGTEFKQPGAEPAFHEDDCADCGARGETTGHQTCQYPGRFSDAA